MWIRVLLITSIITVAISFGASLAHLLELYNKLKLSGNEYLIVQQIYRGWALLGIVVILALISTFLQAIATKRQPSFAFNLASAICVLLSLLIFFVFIFPANQQTHNWTILPDNWQQLRNRWEFSHATNAVLLFIALMMLIMPLVKKSNQ